MATVFPPSIQDLMPWDNLQDYINDWTKGLQELADAQSPDDDNQHRTYVPHSWINTIACTRLMVNQVTTVYNDWIHSYGQQTYMYTCNIKIDNNVASIGSWTNVGKCAEGAWSNFSAEQRQEIAELFDAWNLANDVEFRDLYPAEYLELQLDHYDAYSQRLAISDVGRNPQDSFIMDVIDVNGTANITPIKLWFYPQEFTTTTIDPMGEFIDIVGRQITDQHKIVSGIFDCPYQQPLIWCTSDETTVQKYVAVNGSNHNYTTTYNTGDGDEFKVYYGDNYVIYVVPEGDEISYDDVYNVTKDVVLQIDPTIHVPTYKENKYGPEPEPIVDDDYIDMGLGVETDGMAMYNMAVLTRDELIQLIGDFETNADTGLSFLPHVLGLYKLGIESSQLLTTNSDTINLHKEPGMTAFVSTDNYNIVDEQLQVIDCGSITVNREELLTNTFLDFSPYTTYEMFIPGCGWITLPDTVVGRTISVHIVFDLTTCSCKGVVRSEGELLGGGGSTLATVNGIIGSSVPLSINETGLQRGAIMSGAVQTVTALGTTAMGVGIGNPYMGMSGIAMAAGSLADTHIAGNATYTSTKGGATDYSVFGDGYKAVLKITRPKLEIPDNYGHTVGYVVNKYDTLGNYSGFTVCLNPHVTGLTCTSDEKDEIARLLERGVILPSGE